MIVKIAGLCLIVGVAMPAGLAISDRIDTARAFALILALVGSGLVLLDFTTGNIVIGANLGFAGILSWRASQIRYVPQSE